MNDNFFLDTNIFVYNFDNKNTFKQKRAKQLTRTALVEGGIISWQVIQEFANVALHKFEKPMNRDDLRDYIQTALLPLCAVWPGEAIYHEALTVGLETGYRWYDSLILASAVKAQAHVLYSEDLQHDRVYRGTRVLNPFHE